MDSSFFEVSTTMKGNTPRSPTFHGARSVREIDNFFLGSRSLFMAIDIEDDAQKVSNVAFSLKEITYVWWHRRCGDIRCGSDLIHTWDEFKKKLKKQFYPKDAENEAREKLRRLQHKEGHIWEFIREFEDLLLEGVRWNLLLSRWPM